MSVFVLVLLITIHLTICIALPVLGSRVYLKISGKLFPNLISGILSGLSVVTIFFGGTLLIAWYVSKRLEYGAEAGSIITMLVMSFGVVLYIVSDKYFGPNSS